MTKIFISYKRYPLTNATALALYEGLINRKYDVFLDRKDIDGGIGWEKTIFDDLYTSDVVILLLTENVVESSFVKREIAFAKAWGITILPLVLQGLSEKTVTDVMDNLRILDIQHKNELNSTEFDIRFSEVLSTISRCTEETRENQKHLLMRLDTLLKSRVEKDPFFQVYKPFTQTYLSFKYKKTKTRIHITAGDIKEVSGIDIIINPENVYMQMQRVFERESISKRLRVDGAEIDHNHVIIDDTIQHSLNLQLAKDFPTGVPVKLGSVVITNAGKPNSELHNQGFKYIFHVAVQDADINGPKKIVETRDIKKCVNNCFDKFSTLHGVTSIIFPVLGSGNAGLDFSTSATAMIESIKRYLDNNPQSPLKDIYISGYTRGNVEVLANLLIGDGDFSQKPK